MLVTDEWGFSALTRRSATDHVLAELRGAIVAGRIRPGAPLRESALARSLGTGRSAVREAVRQLVQEGLVLYRPNRGTVVRAVTVRDSRDLYLAREVIEVAAVQQAMEREQGPDLGPLRDALKQISIAAAANDRDAPAGVELIAADLDFHRELVRLAGSTRLSRAHETLAAEAQMLLHHQPVYSPTDYATDHAILLEAISARDPEAPERVREHLRLSSRLIAGELARRDDFIEHVDDHTEET
ncbi:MAG TPA: GntR family transcriptional regulator [Solirubrobacteraceae bacterium]|nr:GntR family transcriptional regulator [Solirubrobacteraceae bacterium]